MICQIWSHVAFANTHSSYQVFAHDSIVMQRKEKSFCDVQMQPGKHVSKLLASLFFPRTGCSALRVVSQIIEQLEEKTLTHTSIICANHSYYYPPDIPASFIIFLSTSRQTPCAVGNVIRMSFAGDWWWQRCKVQQVTIWTKMRSISFRHPSKGQCHPEASLLHSRKILNYIYSLMIKKKVKLILH